MWIWYFSLWSTPDCRSGTHGSIPHRYSDQLKLKHITTFVPVYVYMYMHVYICMYIVHVHVHVHNMLCYTKHVCTLQCHVHVCRLGNDL